MDMGTDGLIVQAQSREEILADKWVALAFRANRIKYRDLWDILWLDRQGIRLDVSLLEQKREDRQRTRQAFLSALRQRIDGLENDPDHLRAFRKEMERFLPASDVGEAIRHSEFWSLLMLELQDQERRIVSGTQSCLLCSQPP